VRLRLLLLFLQAPDEEPIRLSRPRLEGGKAALNLGTNLVACVPRPIDPGDELADAYASHRRRFGRVSHLLT
jgi:hypothetical protein